MKKIVICDNYTMMRRYRDHCEAGLFAEGFQFLGSRDEFRRGEDSIKLVVMHDHSDLIYIRGLIFDQVEFYGTPDPERKRLIMERLQPDLDKHQRKEFDPAAATAP